MELSEVERRNIIVAKYLENPYSSCLSIAKLLKYPPKTVSRVIKRFVDQMTTERAKGSGRKPGPVNKKLDKTLKESFKKNPRLSDADRAKKYGVSRSLVLKTRQRHNLKSYKTSKHPNRRDQQNLKAKSRARKLIDTQLSNFKGCILMDDETYVKFDSQQIPGSSYYIASARGNVADRFKYTYHDKFAKKALIWQAICSCGLKSKSYVTLSTMKTRNYIDECLEKRLLPLIRLHRVPVKFWPDLASCHYARETLKWFEDNRVDVIPKDCNPPNSPELRPIEKYWAIVKAKIKKNGGIVSSTKSLQVKWDRNAVKVSPEGVRMLMKSIKEKVRKLGKPRKADD